MISAVQKLAKQKGYVINEKPHYLNIWGFRSDNKVPNSFDDEIHVFTISGTSQNPVWMYWIFKCTTDPGTFWLKNPERQQGTAILNPGQYKNSHAIGLHRGKYTALVQIGILKVTRDYNRNNVLDFNNGKVVNGLYGINIHRASKNGSTLEVDKYSAGCQVFKNAKDFEFFIGLCQTHRKHHGNKFTYTLIDRQMDYVERLKKENASTQDTSQQPQKFLAFSPDLVADLLFKGTKDKNIDKALQGLWRIESVSDYKKVSEVFKKINLANGKVTTIATSLNAAFPKSPQREKYRAQLYRIGLKWRNNIWTLQGLAGFPDRSITTTEETLIWENSGRQFFARANQALGSYISEKNGITEFLSKDGNIQFVSSTSITKNHD
jgi:hypothetical protein